jgi:hypothetical protein
VVLQTGAGRTVLVIDLGGSSEASMKRGLWGGGGGGAEAAGGVYLYVHRTLAVAVLSE